MKTPIQLNVREAVERIQDGDKLVLSHAATTPNLIVEEIVAQKERFTNLQIFQLIYLGEAVHLAPDCAGHIRVCSPFLHGAAVRQAIAEGRADYLPIHFSYVPQIFRADGTFPPDWAIVQVSPADAQGRYSLSLSCDYTLPAARATKHVLAVVNPHMPYLGGDNFLTSGEIDIIVESDTPAFTLGGGRESTIDDTIAGFCADLIPDRACLQMGIGPIPDAVLSKLTDRKDLGIHTEMFTDGVMKLHKTGVITGKYKGSEKGKIISAFVMGSQELYDYIDHNDEFELYTVDYTNDPAVIGKHPNFISINSCVEIDLYGQVCSEKVNGQMFSGSGGQLDYLRGVRYSEGGKSILAMPSTAKGGTLSRIVPNLHPQGVVTSPRNDVDYIITEYGTAHLFGRSQADRALALCDIAHPDFRDELLRQAYERFAIRKVF